MGFQVIALSVLISSSLVHGGQAGWKRKSKGNDINRETRALRALFGELNPILDQVQATPLVDCGTTSNLCFGQQLTQEKIGAARKSCGDNTVCFMKALNWMGEDRRVRREVIQEDLAKTPLAESLRGAEQQCFERQKTVQRKTIQSVLRGDARQFLEAVFPFENDSEVCGHIGLKSIGQVRGHSKAVKNQRQRQAKIKVTSKLVRAARDVAYMGCIHNAFQAACSKKANTILRFQPDQNSRLWQWAWTDSELVPTQLCQVPPPANVIYPSGVAPILPGTRLFTQNLQDAPYIGYDNDPNSLYTIMVVDVDSRQSGNLFHWMRVNIPGGNIQEGTDVFDYLPSFAIEVKKAKHGKSFLTTNDKASNKHLILVYRQSGPITPNEGQRGCNYDLIKARVQFEGNNLSPQYFADKYALAGPVAGTFIRVGYSGQATQDMACRISKCLCSPFPTLLAGINDKPECSPA